MILGVSPDHVLRLADGGHLKRLGYPARFLEEEVRGLSRVRRQVGNTSVVAAQALALAKKLERELAEVKLLLRMDSVHLSMEKVDVVQLFVQVEGLCVRGAIDLTDVDKWMSTLLAVDETYLKLVARFTGEQDPWLPYLKLAQMIFENTEDKERAKADYVRRNLRNVGYMYTRAHDGPAKANARFKGDSFISRLLCTAVEDAYP